MLACICLKKGEGIPFVFLHGFLGSSRDWTSVANALPHPSFAIDLPGHGETPDNPIDFETTHALLDQVLPPRCHLVGYSLGGRIAATYAHKTHEKIASLTLISAHPGLKEGYETRWAQDLAWAHRFEEEAFDAVLSDWYNQPLFSTLRGKTLLIRKILQIQKPKRMAQALLAFSLARQKPVATDTLNATWIYGLRDLPYRRLYATISGRVIGFEGGHALHRELPEQIAHELDITRSVY